MCDVLARAGLAFAVVVRIEWRWGKEFSGKVSCTQLKTPVEKLSSMAEKVLPGREELGGGGCLGRISSLGWTLRDLRVGLGYQHRTFSRSWHL